jgi:hypothetical protein
VGTYEHEGTNRLFVFVRNDIEVNTSGFNSIWELNQGDSSFTKIIESNNIRLSGDPLNIDECPVQMVYAFFPFAFPKPGAPLFLESHAKFLEFL